MGAGSSRRAPPWAAAPPRPPALAKPDDCQADREQTTARKRTEMGVQLRTPPHPPHLQWPEPSGNPKQRRLAAACTRVTGRGRDISTASPATGCLRSRVQWSTCASDTALGGQLHLNAPFGPISSTDLRHSCPAQLSRVRCATHERRRLFTTLVAGQAGHSSS